MRLSRLIKHWGVARNPAGGDKRPWGISPTSGGWMPLSTTDTRGWMTAAEAWKRAKSLGPSARVGALLTPGCGVTVVDMDEDYDGNQMAMVEWLDSYAETSSSGRGTHIFVRANLAGGGRHAQQDTEGHRQQTRLGQPGNQQQLLAGGVTEVGLDAEALVARHRGGACGRRSRASSASGYVPLRRITGTDPFARGSSR